MIAIMRQSSDSHHYVSLNGSHLIILTRSMAVATANFLAVCTAPVLTS